jgi:hypothetical protein
MTTIQRTCGLRKNIHKLRKAVTLDRVHGILERGCKGTTQTETIGQMSWITSSVQDLPFKSNFPHKSK